MSFAPGACPWILSQSKATVTWWFPIHVVPFWVCLLIFSRRNVSVDSRANGYNNSQLLVSCAAVEVMMLSWDYSRIVLLHIPCTGAMTVHWVLAEIILRTHILAWTHIRCHPRSQSFRFFSVVRNSLLRLGSVYGFLRRFISTLFSMFDHSKLAATM